MAIEGVGVVGTGSEAEVVVVVESCLANAAGAETGIAQACNAFSTAG